MRAVDLGRVLNALGSLAALVALVSGLLAPNLAAIAADAALEDRVELH